MSFFNTEKPKNSGMFGVITDNSKIYINNTILSSVSGRVNFTDNSNAILDNLQNDLINATLNTNAMLYVNQLTGNISGISNSFYNFPDVSESTGNSYSSENLVNNGKIFKYTTNNRFLTIDNVFNVDDSNYQNIINQIPKNLNNHKLQITFDNVSSSIKLAAFFNGFIQLSGVVSSLTLQKLNNCKLSRINC